MGGALAGEIMVLLIIHLVRMQLGRVELARGEEVELARAAVVQLGRGAAVEPARLQLQPKQRNATVLRVGL